MNPSDLSIWMGHYAPERPMLIDDTQGYSQQGLMEDLAQQTHAMVNILYFSIIYSKLVILF